MKQSIIKVLDKIEKDPNLRGKFESLNDIESVYDFISKLDENITRENFNEYLEEEMNIENIPQILSSDELKKIAGGKMNNIGKKLTSTALAALTLGSPAFAATNTKSFKENKALHKKLAIAGGATATVGGAVGIGTMLLLWKNKDKILGKTNHKVNEYIPITGGSSYGDEGSSVRQHNNPHTTFITTETPCAIDAGEDYSFIAAALHAMHSLDSIKESLYSSGFYIGLVNKISKEHTLVSNCFRSKIKDIVESFDVIYGLIDRLKFQVYCGNRPETWIKAIKAVKKPSKYCSLLDYKEVNEFLEKIDDIEKNGLELDDLRRNLENYHISATDSKIGEILCENIKKFISAREEFKKLREAYEKLNRVDVRINEEKNKLSFFIDVFKAMDNGTLNFSEKLDGIKNLCFDGKEPKDNDDKHPVKFMSQFESILSVTSNILTIDENYYIGSLSLSEMLNCHLYQNSSSPLTFLVVSESEEGLKNIQGNIPSEISGRKLKSIIMKDKNNPNHYYAYKLHKDGLWYKCDGTKIEKEPDFNTKLGTTDLKENAICLVYDSNLKVEI